MKLTLLLLIASLHITGCSVFFPLVDEDCGYSASYSVPKDGGEIEVTFSEVQAEVLDGRRECGFRYVPSRVTKAKLHGDEMREVNRGGTEFVYLAPSGFDPAIDPISIEVSERGYVSKLDSVRRIDERVFFSLRRFPPK